MSEYITHTSIMEDCFNIVLFSKDIVEIFKDAIRNYKSFAYLGSITRGGDTFIVKLLSKYKDEWNTSLEHRLAFILGWLCHRATDREMKPLYRKLEPASTIFPTDSSIYQDIFILKELYIKNLGENNTLLEKSLNKTSSIPESLINLSRLIFQRLLIEIHTLIPDEKDVEGWIDRLFKLKQEFCVNIKRYEDIFNNPEEEKFKRFIIDVNFFNDLDPIITIAKNLRRNKDVKYEEIISALHSNNTSYYAKALILSYNYMLSASDFSQGKIDENLLSDRLNIGKLGEDGEPV